MRTKFIVSFFQKYAYYFLVYFFGGLARGLLGAQGPRFIEPPEPPVATPLTDIFIHSFNKGAAAPTPESATEYHSRSRSTPACLHLRVHGRSRACIRDK